jgi:hypothetical protein
MRLKMEDGGRKPEIGRNPTISDPRFYKTLEDRQKFFERVCAETPPVQPAFMHRPFFTRRKHQELPNEGTKI